MNFVLDELIFVMFLIFVCMFVLFTITMLHRIPKTLKQPKDFTPKVGKEVHEMPYIFSSGIKLNNDAILKEKHTHFTER